MADLIADIRNKDSIATGTVESQIDRAAAGTWLDEVIERLRPALIEIADHWILLRRVHSIGDI